MRSDLDRLWKLIFLFRSDEDFKILAEDVEALERLLATAGAIYARDGAEQPEPD